MQRWVFGALLAFAGSSSVVPAASPPDPRALFALERQAVGGDAWNGAAAITQNGSTAAGGSTNAFSQITDHRTGFFRQTMDIGPLHDVNGFDGKPWDDQNGALAPDDLPGDVADAVSQAYVARDGWWHSDDPATMSYAGVRSDAGTVADVIHVLPANGSALDVWLDTTTHLIVRVVAHGDQGDVTASLADYRTVGRVRLPFREVSVDATGATTTQTIERALTAPAIAAADIARPQETSNGRFEGAAHAVIPFQFDAIDTGHLIVPAGFGGKNATVYFDTGGANFLLPSAAAQLGFHSAGGMNSEGVGNASVNAGFAAVGTVAFGSARLDRQVAIVEPLPYGFEHPRAGIQVQGLVGAELMGAFAITFDYAGRTISLVPFGTPPPQGTTVPIYTSGAHPYVEATIDGVTGIFGIDTGDGGGITVFRHFAEAHGLFTQPGVAYASPGGVGGGIGLEYYRAKSFVFGGTTLARPTVDVTDATGGAFASRSLAGNIGAQILDRYTMTIDLHSHTATFLPNGRANQPFRAYGPFSRSKQPRRVCGDRGYAAFTGRRSRREKRRPHRHVRRTRHRAATDRDGRRAHGADQPDGAASAYHRP